MDDDLDYKTVVAFDGETETPVKETGSRAYLVLLAGSNVGEVFALEKSQVLGRGKEADVRLRGEGISRRHARLIENNGEVMVEDLGSTNGTFVNGEPVSRVVLKDGDKIQIGDSIILKFSYRDKLEESFQRRMYESASRDPLTRAYNKRFFIEHLELELGYARRHHTPLALMMLDLDHFKQVNDTYGHAAGDYVLSEFANTVTGIIRNEDVFARYGGEEFVVLSRSIDSGAAGIMAERLRAAVADHPFVFEQRHLAVTVSIGVAAYPEIEAEANEDLMVVADRALYQAKREGRNRVVVAGRG